MKTSKLDKYQRKAVRSNSKNLLVIAGAGSGKTFTIVEKIKEIIKDGLSSEEILCISFTNAAAKNLEDKLKKQNIHIKVNTFHSLGYRIISEYKTVKPAKDDRLEKIIEKNISKEKYLREILNLKFIRLGSPDKIYNKLENNIIKNSEYKSKLKKIMIMFINIYKSGNHKIKDFETFEKINKNTNLYNQKKRHKKFLILIKRTIKSYNTELIKHHEIDFHDMINMATNIVKRKSSLSYKYIIIDEYQDTSLNKTELIKEIQKKSNAKLMVVGDDWQSIYAFTGSNLEVFTNFKKIFPNSKIIKLKNTYRNSKELVKVTEKFICKNPNQLKKKIKSNKKNPSPIKIYYYQNSPNEILEKILKKINSNSTLILGRNNKDINIIPKKYRNRFMTIHKSKGLETENTVIINLEDKYDSLPSKIKESEYLKYVKPKIDNYQYAEERRLFYVALTRTKNQNYLLVNKNNPSTFVTELIKNRKKYIEIIDLIKK